MKKQMNRKQFAGIMVETPAYLVFSALAKSKGKTKTLFLTECMEAWRTFNKIK